MDNWNLIPSKEFSVFITTPKCALGPKHFFICLILGAVFYREFNQSLKMTTCLHLTSRLKMCGA